jgi:predicted signal transduction protein with EAL and GGDEF domain
LAVTGTRIAEALRTGDTASRVGGDEFVLVCATTEATEDAARLAKRLLAAIGQPIELDGDYVSVGASIGISMFPVDGVTGDELISHADTAMYEAKQSGRNLFRMYRDEAHSSIVAALDFETDLRRALERHEIVVHYQPILSLHTNELLGAEALVRWQHPRRGLLHPAEFLAFAESHRLIGAIGSIVLDAVCAQIAKLGRGATDSFHISMNVSAGQIMQPGWVDEIAAALAAHGADAQRLHVEIAESVVTHGLTSVLPILEKLRDLGVSLSIDDFGTGVTSLASIKDYPLQTIKIDRSFVHEVATNLGDQAMAKTIIMLAHSLGLRVIAAGVETQAQVNALREFGSDAFQGYIASRPMDAEDLTTFIATHPCAAASA